MGTINSTVKDFASQSKRPSFRPEERTAGRRVSLEQLEQAKPYKPTCQSEDFSTAKLLTDELLERAGAAGMTVPELRARGCGERPPNRVVDLRKDGQAIVTRRDPNGVTRYIKAKFLKPDSPATLSPYMARMKQERAAAAPLFAGVDP